MCVCALFKVSYIIYHYCILSDVYSVYYQIYKRVVNFSHYQLAVAQCVLYFNYHCRNQTMLKLSILDPLCGPPFPQN